MLEIKAVSIESFMVAWDAANEAIASGNVVPIELGKSFELDGVEMKLTDHPINRMMLAVVKALEDKEVAVSAAFRIWSLLGLIGAQKLSRWVDPARGVRTVLLHAAAQCDVAGLELDLSDLVVRTEEMLRCVSPSE